MKKNNIRYISLLAFLLPACQTFAAPPNDFRVLTDELSEPGEFGVEQQFSMGRPSRNLGPNQPQVFQGLTEFSYGLAKQWELSLQLPVFRQDRPWRSTGANLELEHIAPHQDEGFYWGGRVEIGYERPVDGDDPASWQLEFRPVLGYRAGNWHAVLNPGVVVPVSGPDRKADFQPYAKLGYQVNKQNMIGFEYYLDAGPLSHPLPASRRQELALFVLDTKIGKADINLGVGRGLNGASDGRVAKLLVSFELD